jgi:hypothetical protein
MHVQEHFATWSQPWRPPCESLAIDLLLLNIVSTLSKIMHAGEGSLAKSLQEVWQTASQMLSQWTESFGSRETSVTNLRRRVPIPYQLSFRVVHTCRHVERRPSLNEPYCTRAPEGTSTPLSLGIKVLAYPRAMGQACIVCIGPRGWYHTVQKKDAQPSRHNNPPPSISQTTQTDINYLSRFVY